ncbi:MAG: S41 family peptidase [Bdellovibrionota bacterium]
MTSQHKRFMAITLLLCLFSFPVSRVISGEKEKAHAKSDKSRFEKIELFNKVLFLIESNYYRDIDTEKLIEGAIKGMMGTLDPHSAYLDEEVFTKMQEDTQGEFGGLGLEVTQKDGVMVVITPIEDTPAFKAGIKSGDKIVEIDGDSTLGMTLDEAVDKMRGGSDTKITLGIVREGFDGIKHFDMKRKIIKLESVKSQLLDEVMYLRLTQFQKSSAESLEDHLKKMKAKLKTTPKGIILDLRSNPGGLLDEAVDVASLFLRDGVVVSTEGRDPKSKEIRNVKKTGYKEIDIPMVLLINGSSASASEIVAGALQDHKRAVIMGTQSFGKGSVQTVAKLDDYRGVKLTFAQYMTPSGSKIQALGIKPDIELDELETSWQKKSSIETSYLRESDLRNHLTATIETPEEKTQRIEKEKKARAERIKKIELRRKQKETVKEESEEKDYVPEAFNPAQDYQVVQATNFLKGISVFKVLNKQQ